MVNRLILLSIWLGITATIGQIVLLRESLVLFYGNELSIGLMLATWLFWVSFGSILGARMKVSSIKNQSLIQGTNPNSEYQPPQQIQQSNSKNANNTPELQSVKFKSHTYILFLLFLINLALPISLLLFRSLRVLLRVPPEEMLTFTQIISTAFFCQSIFPFSLGLLFSYFCRLVNNAQEIGKIYLYESVGALIGGTVYTFYLVTTTDPFSIWVALFALSVLAFYAFIRQPQELMIEETEQAQNLQSESRFRGNEIVNKPQLTALRSLGILVLCLIAILLSISDIGNKLDTLSVRWRWTNQKLVETRDSVYGNIAVTDIGLQKNIYVDGTLLYSIPNPIDDETFAHFTLLEHPDPFQKKILLLGLGGGSI
ncbi:MAG: hypothetical protein N3A72_12415, partial [bacterium]|nr:hypothetical protein [bacterium]